MSIVILFGAGASFGAGTVHPTVPPLGKDLFRELGRDFSATWGSLPDPIKREFHVNFENGMNYLWRSGSRAIPLLMQHMAIFFAKYQLPTARRDSFSLLLAELSRIGKRVMYSTLNYDCLFEIAASMAGKSINYFNEAGSDSNVIIWKLHGSCNFLPEGGVTATRGVSFSPGVSFSTDIRTVNLGEVPAYCLGDTGLYPVMSIYAQGKPVQIAADILRTIQAKWTKSIMSADAIAIIGANPHPPDGHIWNPLAESNARILYVGNKEAFSAWSTEYRPKKESVFIGEDFSSSIKALVSML